MKRGRNRKTRRREGFRGSSVRPLLSSFLPSCLRVFLSLFLSSCGYHAVYGGEDAGGLHVVLARSLVADAVASDEVVSAVREELAKEGALAAGEGYPRVEVEVLRADEASEGIAAPSAALGAGAGGAPRARATEVGFVARAWVVRAANGERERDTGDVRAMDLVASEVTGGVANARADAFHHADALRAVARRVGQRLALRLLGNPTAGDEGVGRER
jgi:hypothetical protein